MIRFQIPLLFALSCAALPRLAAAPAPCRTPCGMTATEGDCESLQRYEGRVLKGLARGVPEWSTAKICAGVNGWRVEVHHRIEIIDHPCSAPGWLAVSNLCVLGLTEFQRKAVTVATPEWEHSALAHEIAHVVETKGGHCHWKPALHVALHDLSDVYDESKPEDDCEKQ